MGILRKYGTPKSGRLSRFVPGVHPCSTSPCILLQQGWASLWSQVGLQMSTPRLIMAYRLIDVCSTYIIIYHDIFIGRYNYCYYYVLICINMYYMVCSTVCGKTKPYETFLGGPLHDLTPTQFTFQAAIPGEKMLKIGSPKASNVGHVQSAFFNHSRYSHPMT